MYSDLPNTMSLAEFFDKMSTLELKLSEEQITQIAIRLVVALIEEHKYSGIHGQLNPRTIQIDIYNYDIEIATKDNIAKQLQKNDDDLLYVESGRFKDGKHESAKDTSDIYAIGVILYRLAHNGKFPATVKSAMSAHGKPLPSLEECKTEMAIDKKPLGQLIKRLEGANISWTTTLDAVLTELNELSDSYTSSSGTDASDVGEAMSDTEGASHTHSGIQTLRQTIESAEQRKKGREESLASTSFPTVKRTMESVKKTSPSLAKLIEEARENSPLSLLAVAKIGLGILEAVQEASKTYDYIHGNLKPEDFSVNLSTYEVTYNRTGTEVQEDQYRHIEQFQPAQEIADYHDIYAIGVMLTELATGRLPMSQKDEQTYRTCPDTPSKPSDDKQYINILIIVNTKTPTENFLLSDINDMTSNPDTQNLDGLISALKKRIDSLSSQAQEHEASEHRGDTQQPSSIADSTSTAQRHETSGDRTDNDNPKSSSIVYAAAKCGFWGGAAGLGVGVVAVGIALTLGYFLLAPVSIPLTAALVLAGAAAGVVLGPTALGAIAGAASGAVYASCRQ